METVRIVRVYEKAAELCELISVAVDSPLRLGAGDPEVLDGVLEIALEVGLIARGAEGRAATQALIARVLDDAIVFGRLDPGRMARLQAEADLVRASLEQDTPRSERHVRSVWALTRAGEMGRPTPSNIGPEPDMGSYGDTRPVPQQN